MRCFGQWAYDLLNSPSKLNTSTWALGLYSNKSNAEQPIGVDAYRRILTLSLSYDRTKQHSNEILR